MYRREGIERAVFVAIPLEQGLFFNNIPIGIWAELDVAIPLEQGLFFNPYLGRFYPFSLRRNPFGAGTIF